MILWNSSFFAAMDVVPPDIETGIKLCMAVKTLPFNASAISRRVPSLAFVQVKCNGSDSIKPFTNFGKAAVLYFNLPSGGISCVKSKTRNLNKLVNFQGKRRDYLL